jgi:hypothetical protein
MNIVYNIDSQTGKLKLKFKQNILDNLDKDAKEAFNKYILPMLTMNNKFVLTGSLSLRLLGLEPMSPIGDFDFGLREEFTEEDYNNIKNFFDLNDMKVGYGWDGAGEKFKIPYKFDPKERMWQFSKSWDDVENDILGVDLSVHKYFKIDIFNDEILRKKDIITIYYDDFELRLIHPSITYSYRMRYALDPRSSTAFKYWERMVSFIKDAKPYYNTLRALYNMIARVNEHNINIEGDKKRIEYIRGLVIKREYNMDEFFKKVWDEPITE